MTLAAGYKLGPYEVVAPIGAGGMGEVYRARDSRLGRDVALKVLPEAFAQDAQRMQRFQREAQLLASLNHSNIAAIYGLEESGPTRALVMELVEGPTLADRIAQGPVPLDEALPIAKQIAEALEYAHDRGIIHRDLKPANIKLTADGKVKVLDFGLAKALDDSPAAADMATSPTLTAAATRVGIILGTAAYMSPEQAKGRPADRRADVWSFGVVLYETLTGARAFPGEEVSETLAGVIKDEPDWKKLPGSTSPRVRELLRRCLTKDPAQRLQAIGEARIAIEEILGGKEDVSANLRAAAELRAGRSPRLWWMLIGGIVFGAVLTALAAVWLGYSLAARQQNETPLHVQVPPPEKAAFDATGDYGGVPTLSPQGDRLVFSAHGPSSPKALWVRPLDSFAAQRLEGTDGAAHPFWSPDGRYIGFFANGKIHKVLATGGPVISLADAENPRGGCWCNNDVILFAPNFQGPLMRVSASGGSATPATTVDTAKHTTHRWPSCLPDGKHFLYLATNHQGGRAEDNGVYYGSLDGKENRLVIPSDAGALYASGYLLYHAQTSLMAQAFDSESGKLSGEAVAVLDKVKYDSGVWRTLFTVSNDGILGYLPGGAGAQGTQLVWYDRSGKTLNVAGEHSTYSDPRLSPDGKRLAFVSGDPIWDVWILDLERGTRTRVTFDQSVKAQPAWSPDGKTLAFMVTKVGGAGAFGTIHTKAANGSGADQVLAAESGNGLLYPQYSPDGKYLVYLRRQNARALGIYAKPLDGNGAPVEVVGPAGPQADLGGFRISPNGRWIAYQSNESGRNEIYIAPFPRGEGKWQVSTSGGNFPAWRGDSRELFFWNYADELFASTIAELGGELQIGTPQFLFRAYASAVGTVYDATRDGQRFLVNRAEEEAPASLNLVVHWTAELKKK